MRRLSSPARHAAGLRALVRRKHHRQRLRPSHFVNRRAWARVHRAAPVV